MQKKIAEKREWGVYPIFHDIPWFSHGTTLRRGGVSQDPFATWNMSFEVGDDPKAVKTNRNRLTSLVGNHPLIEPIQCHGKRVVLVDKKRTSPIEACDALITKEEGVVLGVKHADCQAALFLDPIHKAYGVVHAGWRGLAQNIYKETIVAMRQTFGTQPADLLVAISASLGPTIAEFQNYKNEWPEEYWSYQIQPYYFDLWTLAEEQLIAEGIQEKHIEVARICTYNNPEEYFSYRREKQTGRHLTFGLRHRVG